MGDQNQAEDAALLAALRRCLVWGIFIGVLVVTTAYGWGNAFADLESFIVANEKILTVMGSVAVALFTGTLYLATVGLVKASSEQLATMRRSLDVAERSARATESTLMASQRPWVSVEVGLAGPLVISASEVRLDVGFTLKNVGKSPAMNVLIEPKLISFMPKSAEFHPNTFEKNLRNEIKQRPVSADSILGNTIFPDETLRQPMGLSISTEELKNQSHTEDQVFGIDIRGFVSYRTTLDNETHVTYFSGSIRKINPANRNLHLLFSYSDTILQPGTEYALWADPFIGGRID